jgi:hypothetical protein
MHKNKQEDRTLDKAQFSHRALGDGAELGHVVGGPRNSRRLRQDVADAVVRIGHTHAMHAFGEHSLKQNV